MFVEKKDLIVLVADKDLDASIRVLLGSPARLEIRAITFEVKVHPLHDSGVYKNCQDILRLELRRAERALVLFDRHGCGKEARTRQELEEDAERRLAANGWKSEAAAVVVIDPELEQWMWDSPSTIAAVIGRSEDWVLDCLRQAGFMFGSNGKPQDPKGALGKILSAAKYVRSSAFYREFVQRLDYAHCSDPAFSKLLRVLSNWFPPSY